MPQTYEPWDSQRVLEHELMRLLMRLTDGPLSGDQLNRHCLPVELLVPLLADRDALTGEHDDLASLIDMLASPRGDAYNPKVRARQRSVERVRQRVNWLHFSKRDRRLAQQRAQYLADEALSRGWIDELPEDDLWIITTTGVLAMEIMRVSRA